MQTTAMNISKIEEKLGELPILKTYMIKRYEEEKKMQLKLNIKTDHMKDREVENIKLFKHILSTAVNYKVNEILIEYSKSTFKSTKFVLRR